jgi:hypothetical protein
VSGQLHSPVALPIGKKNSTNLIGGWVGPIAGAWSLYRVIPSPANFIHRTDLGFGHGRKHNVVLYAVMCD